MAAGVLKGRYETLRTNRDPFLTRARKCATVTIPMLVPPEGANGSTEYPTPWQAVGARCVNNLAAKLLLALLPPNSPFFRLAIDDYMLEKLAQKPGMRAETEKALNKIERAVMLELETTPTRAPVFEALKMLIVSGNALIHMLPDGGAKLFRLDQFVCKRDPAGHLLEAVTLERVSVLEIPEAHRAFLLGDQMKDGKEATEDNLEIYTGIKKTDTGFEIHQEVNGKEVPGSNGSYPLDKSPWMALRLIAVAGEDYGRGMVEEYLGDFMSLEGLSQAIVEGAAAASKVVFMVAPNSSVNVKEVTRAASGSFVTGKPEDIKCLQVEKYGDFKVALEMRSSLIEALSFSFLLNTAVQRKGERVTAEEIRYMATELDSGLGGIYSTLSQEFQLPLVTCVMTRMEKAKRLPQLPKGIVRPMITTGIEAIGRGNDLTKLAGLLVDLQPLGPEAIAKHMNVSDFITRCATARGIDHDGLIRSAEEVAASDQQAMMQQMAEKLGPNAITQGGQMMQNQQQADAAPAAAA